MTTSTEIKLTFRRDRETKKTIRFQEVAEDGEHAVGTLYLRKLVAIEQFGDPQELQVIIRG